MNNENKNVKQNSTGNKVLSVIGAVLCVILIPILIVNVTLIAKSYINKNEVPSFAGLTPMIVLSNSMQPEIDSGDLIICKITDATDVKVGDVISFFDPMSTSQSVVTHRVVEVIKDDDKLFFKTKGDNNSAEDSALVTADKLVGVYNKRIPNAGNAAMFLQTTPGLIVCVICPLMIMIAYDIFRRKQYDKSCQQDTQALLAELEALKAEKDNNKD